MIRHFSTKKLVGFSIFATLLLYAFSGSHPTTISGGYTGAPNDNVCLTCHSPGGSLDGTIEINGLPSNVNPDQTYPITVTITNTAGSAVRAGFQMVSLKSNLANGGTFSVPVTESNAQVKTAAGKSYVGHQPAKNFSSNVATFDVEWTAPSDPSGTVTVYAAAIIANGASGNNGDKFVATNQAVTLGGGGGDPLTATFSNIVDASCFDSNDGGATVNAMGGSGNYMYNWDNGETTATAVMLPGGDRSVTISDDSNNEIVETVTIGAPDPIVPAILSQTDAICNGEMSGTAELTAAGGTPGYIYDWGNGITGEIQNNLAAGSYFVTITDFNGCDEIINVIIGQPGPIDINIISQNEPSCSGDDDGAIVVEATGGNGNFTYNWLDGVGIPNGGTLNMIPMGEYQVEVIDQNGCTNQTMITLGEPDPVTSTISGTDILCFGGNDGTATVEGQGGSGGFTYEWSNGGSGATQTNLTAGTYFVTVADSDNCTTVNSIELFEPNTPVEAGITVINQPNCGNQDGELSAFGIGGNPDYSYLWNDGSTNGNLSNIASGEYSVTVTDLNGCTDVETVLLQDNDGITLAANDVGNNICFGDMEGMATISASGGTGVYTFSWSNGGTNATENNLAAGEYSITVTDEGNCTGEITIEITEPEPFVPNEILTNITCNGADNGSIQLNATGGTGPLSYNWNTNDTTDAIMNLIAGIFTVTITDANGCMGEIDFVIEEPDDIVTGDVISISPSCPGDSDGSITINPTGGTGPFSYNWSTGDTTIMADSLSAGDYSISITDENDCEAVFNFTLDDPEELSADPFFVLPSCNGSDDGSLSIKPAGGDGDYSVLWNTGDTTLSIMNIPSGLYSVTITDGNGCELSEELELPEIPAIEPNVSSTNESTNGAEDGTATANPENGIEPYSFLWETGDTTQMIQDLAPGSYDLTVTDANGCTATATAIINNGDCDLSANVDIESISCFGLSDGAIVIDLMGAVNPVTYSWSDGSTEAALTDLDIGNYSVTATDANNCQIQILDMEITEPEDIMASDPIITDASSSSSQDGRIEIEFSGGTGELDIQYTDGNSNPIGLESFDNLQSGSYGAIVTDENGCMKFFGPFIVGVLSSTNELENIVATIYPNPANSFLTIETEAKLISDPVLYSLSGQLIESSVEKNASRYILDSSPLTNGIYYVKLISDTDIVLRKVMIAH
ncbi:MAG: choice-of-anchor V domain-containing protein [Bacteroidota bacterium]